MKDTRNTTETKQNKLDNERLSNLLDTSHAQYAKYWNDYFKSFNYYSEQNEKYHFNDHQLANFIINNSVQLIGVHKLNSPFDVYVYLVQLSDEKKLQERTGKKYQFDIAKRVLKQKNQHHAIFIFYNNTQQAFRISLISSNYSDGKRTFNYFKRNTFYVEKDTNNKTFLKQFGSCKFESIHEIKTAFSVEPVTKEFYQLLEEWYYRALQVVKFPEDAEKIPAGKNQQLIRFITRIMFVWFMKAKGIIPDKLFDENYIQTILKDKLDKSSSSYYLAILQNLFFATLNTPPKDRKFRRPPYKSGQNPDYMNHGVFRHHKLMENPDAFEELFSKIPFLNGGLFDCLDHIENKIEIRMDGFSDKQKKQPVFPNHLLFNNDPQKPGLINILKTFNFTIDENSTLDSDVALDPELLGNVFENLLASYNPETAQSARKASGSYYTPKEIVDYMTEQAIFHYLVHKTNVSPDKINKIISFNELENDDINQINQDEKKEIVYALLNCKILDPACGSGVFPMGILHRILWILNRIDPKNEIFKQYKLEPLQKIKQSKIDAIHQDEYIRLIDELEKKLTNKTDDYNRKLHIIETCIYGVDIQPIAIQITKLRCFISLLVDEEVNDEEKNMGLHPLPNLDLKFIIANTLIGINNINLFDSFIDDLKKLMHRYFESQLSSQKNKLKEEFNELKEELIKQVDSVDKDIASKLRQFNPFNTDYSHNWFSKELMFGVKDGFDVIIGNPPYIQLQKAVDDKNKVADLYKNQNYQTFERTGDIYCLFYEKGIKLLRKGGILAFITSNKWMRAGYGEKLREFFTKYNPLVLVDLGPNVFESATVDTNILIIQNAENKNSLKAVTINENKKDNIDISEYVQNKSVILTKLTKDAWFIGSDAEQRLKEKIERIGKPLKEWDVKIYYGIKTGLNEAFIITTEKRNEILANCKDEEERKRTEAIIKPILRGRDIKRYYYEWAGLWVILIPAGWTNENRGKKDAENFIMEHFPSLMKYLKEYEVKAKKRDDQGDYWWELRHCAYYPEFEKEKIFFKAVGRNLTFAKVEPGIMLTAPASFLTGNYINYILGVLCCRFTNHYVEQTSDKTGAGDIMLNVQSFERIKIPPITPTNEPIVRQIEALVDKILAAKKLRTVRANNHSPQADTTEWEKEIDKLVYSLYELNEEEIRIIENHP